MPGAKGASATASGADEMPLTTTTNCVEAFEPSEAGTSRLIWVSLLNRICAGVPSKVTDRLDPENWLPIIVASEPGAKGPGDSVAALSTLDTVGDGGGAGVMVSVIGMTRVPAMGPASMVSV